MTIKFRPIDPTKPYTLPSYAHDGDSGLDLTATRKWRDEYGNICYGTNLAVELPRGFEGQVRPRSSVRKYNLALANSIGTIDSPYRGEIICIFKPTIAFDTGEQASLAEVEYQVGDRVAQLVIAPVISVEVELSEEALSETTRGTGGFGSTGN